MLGRAVDEQEKLARAMSRLNLTMGVFVVNMGTAWAPTLSTGNADCATSSWPNVAAVEVASASMRSG